MNYKFNTKTLRTTSRIFISLLLAVAFNKAVAQSPMPLPRMLVAAHPHPHPHVHVHDFEESGMTVTEQETINKTIPLPATSGRRSVTIDNVWGAIHVTGTDSNQVEFVAKKTIHAE